MWCCTRHNHMHGSRRIQSLYLYHGGAISVLVFVVCSVYFVCVRVASHKCTAKSRKLWLKRIDEEYEKSEEITFRKIRLTYILFKRILLIHYSKQTIHHIWNGKYNENSYAWIHHFHVVRLKSISWITLSTMAIGTHHTQHTNHQIIAD